MANEADRFLVDTHLLIWWAFMPEQLPEPARRRLASRDCPLFFSLVSLWEVAIKASLGREDFQLDPTALRMGLLREGLRLLSTDRTLPGYGDGVMLAG